MLLPSTNLAASNSHIGVKPFFKMAINKVVHLGLLQDCGHLLFRGVGVGEKKVFSDCCGEEHRLLSDVSDLAPQPYRIQVSYILSVNKNLSFVRVVKPHK